MKKKGILQQIKKYRYTILIIVCVIALYWFGTENGLMNAYLFPTIGKILHAFSENKELIVLNIFSSFGLLIPSLLISILVAMIIGISLGMSKAVRDTLHPIIYAISVIPSILLSPFALLLAPSFRVASIFIIIYGSFWSTVFSTITGIMTIDKGYLDKAKTLELKGIKKLTRVVLPAASPSILAGFINTLRSAFVMLAFAEMYGSKYGMGYFIKKYADYGMYENTWCGFITMVLVLVVVMQLFDMLKNYLLRWTID